MVTNLFIIINRFYIVISNLYTIIKKLFNKNVFLLIISKVDMKLNKKKKVGYFCTKPVDYILLVQGGLGISVHYVSPKILDHGLQCFSSHNIQNNTIQFSG